MAARPPRPEQILLPVKSGFILLSLVCALFLNLLPVQNLFFLWPDFTAVVLLYWCVQQPLKVGFFSAVMLGVLMDVAYGSLFGEHILAYSILAYLGLMLSRRIRRFSLGYQMLHVVPVLIVPALIILMIRLVSGAQAPGWSFFSPPLIGALLWPIIATLLQLPQRPKPTGVEQA
jgi:rod shape-determining protein MreD